MQDDYFSLMQVIAPDLAREIEKRAFVLERIGALQPVGRRQLAMKLHMPEREIRTVATLLKDHGLITLDAAGMSLTEKAAGALPLARSFSRELRGLTDMEIRLSRFLQVENVLVVPGNVDTDEQVLGEVGKSAAQHSRSFLSNGCTLAVTGGATTYEVARSIVPNGSMNVMVVPARGGFGRTLENEANTVASEIAKRLGGHLRLMYVPDQLNGDTLQEMRKLREVDETLALLERADVVLHSIGRMDEMVQKRHLSKDIENRLIRKEAVGEAFGCYFNIEGKTVYDASMVSHDIGKLKPSCAFIAVAAGAKKAAAIIGAMRNHTHAMLITDEGAADEILRMEKTIACTPEKALQYIPTTLD